MLTINAGVKRLFHSCLPFFRQEDKQQHIIVSCMLMLASLLYLGLLQSVMLVFTIGIVKEIWDKSYGSGFCWYDILGNVLGIMCGIGLNQII